ncbi:hypothetical protein CYMTET_18308 [Cymbomonas tetramitiformis]|uniref:Uncharacterized protein n=1 Tax=Cymbomonas tetramitiformis TaxID=36881 RepID=A0AAE0G8B4_9CHLO|nr:hypothetical protein CYMTET_18308 [Cymbomonas tetramitiformis]
MMAPRAAARKVEESEMVAYGDIHSHELVLFGVEVYGGLGPAAMRFLKKIQQRRFTGRRCMEVDVAEEEEVNEEGDDEEEEGEEEEVNEGGETARRKKEKRRKLAQPWGAGLWGRPGGMDRRVSYKGLGERSTGSPGIFQWGRRGSEEGITDLGKRAQPGGLVPSPPMSIQDILAEGDDVLSPSLEQGGASRQQAMS